MLLSRRQLLYLISGAVGGATAVGDYSGRGEATTTWPMFQYDAANTGANLGVSGPTHGHMETRWTVEESGTSNAVVMRDGIVYATFDGYSLYAVDAATGEVQWTYPLPSNSLGLAVGKDRIFVVTEETVLALNRSNGAEQWTRGATDFFYTGPPTLTDSRLYVPEVIGDANGHIVALNRSDGKKALKTVGVTDAELTAPAVANGSIYAGSDNGTVVTFDTTYGERQWQSSLANGFATAPAVAGSRVYIGSWFGGSFQVFNADNGTEIKRLRNDLGGDVRSPAAVANGVAYVGAEGDAFYAIDLDTGQPAWNHPVSGKVTPPSVVNGSVYFGVYGDHTEETFYGLDTADGTVHWSRTVDAESPPVVTEDAVYVGGNKLHALEPDVRTSTTTTTATPTETTTATPTTTSQSEQTTTAAPTTTRPAETTTAETTTAETTTAKMTTTDREEVSVQLKGERTSVRVGQEAVLKMSAVNLIGNPPMTVQLILQTPSGLSVVETNDVEAGAAQSTATFQVPPGGNKGLRIRIRANDPGQHDITGKIVYYFGDNETQTTSNNYQIPLAVSPATTTKDETTATATENEGTAGMGVVSALGAVGIGALFREIRTEN